MTTDINPAAGAAIPQRDLVVGMWELAEASWGIVDLYEQASLAAARLGRNDGETYAQAQTDHTYRADLLFDGLTCTPAQTAYGALIHLCALSHCIDQLGDHEQRDDEAETRKRRLIWSVARFLERLSGRSIRDTGLRNYMRPDCDPWAPITERVPEDAPAQATEEAA